MVESIKNNALTAKDLQKFEEAFFILNYHQWKAILSEIPNLKENDALMDIVHKVERNALESTDKLMN